jgi:hypothetical protein
MNFYKGMFGRWVSGFGLLMAMSGSVLAQTAYDFNNSTSDWTVLNSTLTAGDYAADWDFSGGSRNNNRITIVPSGGFDTSSAPAIIAITLKNTSSNAGIIFALSTSATGNNGFGYKRVTASNVGSNDAFPTSASDFTTFYYDLNDHSKWTGSNVIRQVFNPAEGIWFWSNHCLRSSIH